MLQNRLKRIVERYALNTEDGTWHGKFRGSFGVIRNYRFLCSESSFTISTGRSKFPPWGVDQDMKGTPNYAIIYKQGKNQRRVMKIATLKMRKGDMVSLVTGGGGGWGNPLKRDSKRVLLDVINEYVTPKDARKVYRVEINGVTTEIDVGATMKLRCEKRCSSIIYKV